MVAVVYYAVTIWLTFLSAGGVEHDEVLYFNMSWFLLTILGLFVYLVWDWLRRKPRMSDVTKKCVFITGCDSGFGRELAVRLDFIGVPVFAGCLTEDGATKLREMTSARLRTVPLNVSDTGSIHKAYNYVKDNLPGGTGRPLFSSDT